MTTRHVPVMLAEVIEALAPRPGGCYVDGTLGGGGHTAALLEASAPDGRVLGLDADTAAIERARCKLSPYGERVALEQRNFREIRAAAQAHGFIPCNGVLLDLGVSSDQLAAENRGFSFQRDEPLDMRFDRRAGPTAADLLNTRGEAELADIFYYFGEERRSRRLARQVVAWRRAKPLTRTSELVSLVEATLGRRRGRLHPATRIFQALRIAVNDELEALKEGLAESTAILAAGGRLAVISFHSLEDRIVKQFIRGHSVAVTDPRLRPITPKPIVPQAAEQRANPRSRSAKLRVAERAA